METAIDETVKNAFMELDYHIRRLPNVKPDELKLFNYAFPSISISPLESVADGRKIAEITMDIIKYRAEYPQEVSGGAREYVPIRTIEQFVDRSVKAVLYSPDSKTAQKAFVLQELKDNIEQNYLRKDKKRTKTIVSILTELCEKLMESAKDDSDTFYSLDTSNPAWKKLDPELQGAKRVKVLNLINRLLDPKVYATIQEHEKQGRFDKGEPCRIRMIRTVVSE